MKILLTGANGYIGKRLIPILVDRGFEIIACVRDRKRSEVKSAFRSKITFFEIDFLQPGNPSNFPKDFDVAFYLIHSMSATIGNFEEKEAKAAQNFVDLLNLSNAKQIIYLTGIINEEITLSKHLRSRLNVENILRSGKVPLTAVRAGIIVGSGSASFEIIRDLVEKLPVMVAPKWLNSKCQPIGVRNILQILTRVIDKPTYFNHTYDVSNGQILTYQQMLAGYARARGLKRWIFTLPIMTPRLSSYWLYFITSTSYNLAVNLVDSMKIDVVGKDNALAESLGIELYDYETTIQQALSIIDKDATPSSWKDSYVSSLGDRSLEKYIKVPSFGVFKDFKERPVGAADIDRIIHNIWSIGGKRGWYYGNWLWKFRGYLDKLVGGIGLRRGRTKVNHIEAGDALDFWRVLVANKEEGRLLLFAEMKLPGEAWLEFTLIKKDSGYFLQQVATFRPFGIFGRMYWYSVLPFHFFVFNGMIDNIISFTDQSTP